MGKLRFVAKMTDSEILDWLTVQMHDPAFEFERFGDNELGSMIRLKSNSGQEVIGLHLKDCVPALVGRERLEEVCPT
jgi:hypothetical protein